MTARGEGILAWLDTAITLRATAARFAAEGGPGRWYSGGRTDDPYVEDWQLESDVVYDSDQDKALVYNEVHPSKNRSVHIALNDPESVLQRCAADRKLLASHQPAEGVGYDPDNDDTPGAYGEIASACSSCGTLGEYAVRFPCHVVRTLAEGYGWQPT
ncbi:DUF6221 family protein [Streptomyces angustmyceticus]|uniref:DUF6221 family protein n=1 Tax=Streptomyces angustmyceticus TaxID=285578 RepID=UPI0036C64FB9